MHKAMTGHNAEFLKAYAAAKGLPRKKCPLPKTPKCEGSPAPSDQKTLKMRKFLSRTSSRKPILTKKTSILNKLSDGNGPLRKDSKNSIQPSRGKENWGQGSGAKHD